jgi:exonuclease III
MRIVNWNCHYGLKIEKYLEILSHSPQILIIQECTKNDFDYVKTMWKFKNWYNDDLNNEKSEYGVAIFSNEAKIEFTEIFNRKHRYVIPYKVSIGKDIEFKLFTVWIKPVDKNYLKPFYDAVKYYRDQKMLDDYVIIIGDFNTFAKEENGRLEILEEEKLSPMINCAKEKRYIKTYYDAQYGYGIDDFCFASKDIVDKIKLTIPDDKWDDKQDKDHRWNGLSDHCPIIVDFDF